MSAYTATRQLLSTMTYAQLEEISHRTFLIWFNDHRTKTHADYALRLSTMVANEKISRVENQLREMAMVVERINELELALSEFKGELMGYWETEEQVEKSNELIFWKKGRALIADRIWGGVEPCQA